MALDTTVTGGAGSCRREDAAPGEPALLKRCRAFHVLLLLCSLPSRNRGFASPMDSAPGTVDPEVLAVPKDTKPLPWSHTLPASARLPGPPGPRAEQGRQEGVSSPCQEAPREPAQRDVPFALALQRALFCGDNSRLCPLGALSVQEWWF